MAKTIVGELKDLFVKFGGDAGDLTGKETTAEMIDALEKVYEDKGDTLPEVTADDNGKVLSVVSGEWDKADAPAELPAVTSDDNGKVLGVVNGVWDKAEASGGSNDFVVTYSAVDNTLEADKTFAEITEAVEAGKNIICIDERTANYNLKYSYTGRPSNGLGGCHTFIAWTVDAGQSNAFYCFAISHSSTGTIYSNQKAIS